MRWQTSWPRNCGRNPPQVGCRPRGAGSTITRRSSCCTRTTAQPRPPSRKLLTPSTSRSTKRLVQRAERLAIGRLHGVGLRAREHREELHEVLAAEAALGLRADHEPPGREPHGAVPQHPVHQPIELGPMDAARSRARVRDASRRPRLSRRRWRATSPAAGESAPASSADRPPPIRPSRTSPARRARSPAATLSVDSQKNDRVRRLPVAPAGTAHALQERADGVGRVGLEHAIEIADVDAQLERRGADDAGVGAVVEALLRELPLFARDGAVVHEHGGAGAPHVLGDGLGGRPRLAEEQALLSARLGRRLVASVGEIRPVRDERSAVAPAPSAGRRRARSRRDVPVSHARIASGLPTVALRPTRWTSCVRHRASRSITLIRCAPRSVPASACTSSMIDEAQIAEQRRLVHAPRHQHHLERLGRRHQQLRGLLQELPAARDPACRRATRTGAGPPSRCRARADRPGC